MPAPLSLVGAQSKKQQLEWARQRRWKILAQLLDNPSNEMGRGRQYAGQFSEQLGKVGCRIAVDPRTAN
jgi:hypothetical protein